MTRWHEIFEKDGQPRPAYRALWQRMENLPYRERKRLEERLEATLREMGVTFDILRDKPWGRRPWFCDLLPQIFEQQEWSLLRQGFQQRLRAFELFLRDVYSTRNILRDEQLPISAVLGSPFFQRAAVGIERPAGSFLHLSGLSVTRLPDGQMAIKHHYFSHASGISYMMQNRRALARVLPEAFEDHSVASLADVPTDILERLRGLSPDSEPNVVLLSPGPGSPAYSEHSFLSRRMGIPLVQGGDLVVLRGEVYLKTVAGLERVHAIYTRVSDRWIDPLVFQRDSLLGVPGLVHCMRNGTVKLVNFIGSQLADDRALLCFAPTIIAYYLGERPLLPTVETYWLGDIDQREYVFENLDGFVIRPLYGERVLTPDNGNGLSPDQHEEVLREVKMAPHQFVAQKKGIDAATVSYLRGIPRKRFQDHILFALRTGELDYEVLPGSLTRISTEESPHTASELGGGSKDTWVAATDEVETEVRSRSTESRPPAQATTSRVAEAFYWIGRYLERCQNLARMIAVIEILETEELNPTERTLYRPVWNRILPPLENPGKGTRRSISTPESRFRLLLDADEPGSVVATLLRGVGNAESILECVSLEAWSVLSHLRSRFERARITPSKIRDKALLSRITRRLAEQASMQIPQFFGVAEGTMVADGGWRFCQTGQMLERAIITSNAACSIMQAILSPDREDVGEHAIEIELSAFLRLLNTRDTYRRVYQMRAEPGPVLDLLWSNRVAPMAVRFCLERCRSVMQESEIDASPATQRTLEMISRTIHSVSSTDWMEFFDGMRCVEKKRTVLLDRLEAFSRTVASIHHFISDGFLNHQVHMRPGAQPLLTGLDNAF